MCGLERGGAQCHMNSDPSSSPCTSPPPPPPPCFGSASSSALDWPGLKLLPLRVWLSGQRRREFYLFPVVFRVVLFVLLSVTWIRESLLKVQSFACVRLSPMSRSPGHRSPGQRSPGQRSPGQRSPGHRRHCNGRKAIDRQGNSRQGRGPTSLLVTRIGPVNTRRSPDDPDRPVPVQGRTRGLLVTSTDQYPPGGLLVTRADR
ncbi:unnamed protein product [Boreogadus saida]